jgi:hypothetical protein
MSPKGSKSDIGRLPRGSLSRHQAKSGFSIFAGKNRPRGGVAVSLPLLIAFLASRVWENAGHADEYIGQEASAPSKALLFADALAPDIRAKVVLAGLRLPLNGGGHLFRTAAPTPRFDILNPYRAVSAKVSVAPG